MLTKQILGSICLITMLLGCTQSSSDKQQQAFMLFLDNFNKVYEPLYKESNIASYEASVSGEEKDYQKAADLTVQINKLFSSPSDFKKLKQWKDGGFIKDSLLARQLTLLYNSFLGNQADSATLGELVRMQSQIENKFAGFRSVVNHKKLSDNQIDSILKNSVKQSELEQAWKSSKEIGNLVAKDIIQLAKKRNELAHKLGFANFYEMRLKLNEQDPKEVMALFDEMDQLTRNYFIQIKDTVDRHLAKRIGIKEDALMPWDYQNRFFQEAPDIYHANLDRIYEKVDIQKIASTFYKGIGLPIDDILARSDLFEKPGKNQHAFCTDIDHQGDVRILTNLRNDAQWMRTILHELGHGTYSKFNDPNLPFLLQMLLRNLLPKE